MCEHLNCRVLAVVVFWYAELGTDVVGTGHGLEASDHGVGEIAPLLCDVLYQRGRIKAGLWHIDVEDSLSCRHSDWHCRIGAFLCSCRGDEER